MSARKLDPIKMCAGCGAEFFRGRVNGRLLDLTQFTAREFCSRSCSNSHLSKAARTTIHALETHPLTQHESRWSFWKRNIRTVGRGWRPPTTRLYHRKFVQQGTVEKLIAAGIARRDGDKIVRVR